MAEKRYQVAVIGSGPAGIYASDILSKSGLPVSIDIFEKLPTPYGLVRYGVAPDHPFVRSIAGALYTVLQRGDIRFFGNVNVGTDITIEDIHTYYDAVIVATGAETDAPLNIPGTHLEGVHGAADFVSWYDGHPNHPRTWNLEAENVAVIGVGNVALDITRMMMRDVDYLVEHTDIPANVEEGLRANKVQNVKIFGRRGPAQVKFSPREMGVFGKLPDVDMKVFPEEFAFNPASEEAIQGSKGVAQVVDILKEWGERDPETFTAPKQIHLHLMQRPVEILGTTRVEGIRMERTRLSGDGNVTGTGEYVDYPVQAVYHATGYASSPIPGLPWNEKAHVIPNEAGRIIQDGKPMPGYYATGWVKRGPVGLIGSTKSDAKETITNLLADAEAGKLKATGAGSGAQGVLDLLASQGKRPTTWQGWELLDTFEKNLGSKVGRERIKVVSGEAMTAISHGEEYTGELI